MKGIQVGDVVRIQFPQERIGVVTDIRLVEPTWIPNYRRITVQTDECMGYVEAAEDYFEIV